VAVNHNLSDRGWKRKLEYKWHERPPPNRAGAEPFTSKNYPGQFVPYEIKLSDGSVKKFNLAIRKDNPTGRWQV